MGTYINMCVCVLMYIIESPVPPLAVVVSASSPAGNFVS